MATHSSVLAWRIPGMAEPGGLLSMGSHRVGHDWNDLAASSSSSRSGQLGWFQVLELWLVKLASHCLRNTSNVWKMDVYNCLGFFFFLPQKALLKAEFWEPETHSFESGLGLNTDWDLLPGWHWSHYLTSLVLAYSTCWWGLNKYFWNKQCLEEQSDLHPGEAWKHLVDDTDDSPAVRASVQSKSRASLPR